MSKKEDPRITRSREKYLNTIYTTNQGYEIKLIEYSGKDDCTVEFLVDNTVKKGLQLVNIRGGRVSYPNHEIRTNKGYIGEGTKKAWDNKNKKLSKSYSTWFKLMDRGNSLNTKKRQPTYKDVRVCEEWYNYQNFAKWFGENYVEGWFLDKDILCPECKEYSPDNCVFVPREINNLLVSYRNKKSNLPLGVNRNHNKYSAVINKWSKKVYLGSFKTPEEAFERYRIVKESYIKEVADKWKSKIDNRVYEAMYNWKVENIDHYPVYKKEYDILKDEVVKGNKIISIYLGLKDTKNFYGSLDSLIPAIEKLEKEDLSEFHYEWEDSRGKQNNFMGIEFNRWRDESYYGVDLQLDPTYCIGEHKGEGIIKDTFHATVEAIKHINNLRDEN